MLIRAHDDGSADSARWRAFVRAQGFGQFIAAGAGRPFAVAVPTQFVLEEARVVLHLARPNPVFAALEENPHAMLSVTGDWAYVPGTWKAIGDEDPARGLPTTYYGAVQLFGTCEVFDDTAQIAEVLRRQLRDVEPDHAYIDPGEHGAHLRAIRAIVLTIASVQAKFKFGGNVDDAHRAHIAERLQQRGAPGDAAARAQMPGR